MSAAVTLIGMAGVGKSVIGKELAKRLNYTFLDVDKIIEEKTKLKLQQIIDKFGEDKFLNIEEKTILELGKFDNCIISPGGSVVYSVEAMKFLKKNSVIIFLDLPLKSIKNQISNISTRGIVGLKKKGLEALFNERVILYKKYADITIKGSKDFDINDVVKIIRKVVHK